MSDFLSNEWVNALETAWNNDKEIVNALSQESFSAIIGYGFINEPYARCYIQVLNGQVTHSGSYSQRDLTLDWDLRAEPKNWKQWLEEEGFGLKNLGPAVALGRLKFAKGDYRGMIKKPKLAVSFLNHFNLMADITTDYQIKEPKKKSSFFNFFNLFKR